MECNKDEALRAKEIAERKFLAKDLAGAKKFALKAQSLFPALEGIDQMITTFDIYLASEVKVTGEKDWYSILSVSTSADDETLKKQFKKLALQLHPDKNKSVGAEGAFQIISEAWNVLSDKDKRTLYDRKRNIRVFQQKTSQAKKPSAASTTANGFYNFAANSAPKARTSKQTVGTASAAAPAPSPAPKVKENNKSAAAATAAAPTPPSAPPPPHPVRPDTFWTSCNKCKMQYEYLRIYLNHNLLCPTCREPFLATENPIPSTGTIPIVQVSNNTGTKQNSCNSRNFQWGPFSRTAGAASATASSAAAAQAANMVHQTYEKVRREREEAQAAVKREEALRRKYNPPKKNASMPGNIFPGGADGISAKTMRGMGNDGGVTSSGFGKIGPEGASSFRTPGGNMSYNVEGTNGGYSWKPRPPCPINLGKIFLKLNTRGILIEGVKIALREKVKEENSRSSQYATVGKARKKQKLKENGGEKETDASHGTATKQDVRVVQGENCSGNSMDPDNKADDSLSFNVPDPDFHDFDEDRSEKSFGSDQVWATYDDEDGMPRYYAFIQKVISLNPFKLKMSFLASRTNSEFGSLNWVSSGFAKTCGEFRIGRYETNDVINMFSHQIKWEKGPRGIIKVFPQKGDIWALYRNWSPDWNENTPDSVLYVYDMVEVLNDYDEDQGITVFPLVKVAGFRTVFRRHPDQYVVKKIPKEEMFRFSHQVPFYKLSGEEAPNLPKDSYELDPAATSKELLQVITEREEEPMATADYVS